MALDADGEVETAGVGLTSVDITNVRAAAAEDALEGEQPGPDVIRAAGEAAMEAANPESDEHGDAAYKENMVRVLTQRALVDAFERAGVDVEGN